MKNVFTHTLKLGNMFFKNAQNMRKLIKNNLIKKLLTTYNIYGLNSNKQFEQNVYNENK